MSLFLKYNSVNFALKVNFESRGYGNYAYMFAIFGEANTRGICTLRIDAHVASYVVYDASGLRSPVKYHILRRTTCNINR